MAYEVTFGFIPGNTLKYYAYEPDGTERTAATALPEIGATGYYVATDATLVAGDFVIVRKTPYAAADVIGQGQYKPEVSAAGITSDLTDIAADIVDIAADIVVIDGIVDEILITENRGTQIIDETGVKPSIQIIVE